MCLFGGGRGGFYNNLKTAENGKDLSAEKKKRKVFLSVLTKCACNSSPDTLG